VPDQRSRTVARQAPAGTLRGGLFIWSSACPWLVPPDVAEQAAALRLFIRSQCRHTARIAADPGSRRSRAGLLSILHSWDQTLSASPAYPLAWCRRPVCRRSTTRWMLPPLNFFLPVKVSAVSFRGKFVAGLRRAFRRPPTPVSTARAWRCRGEELHCLSGLARSEDCVVYAKPPFADRNMCCTIWPVHSSRRHL